MRKVFLLFSLISLLSACGTNPVTGKSQITLMNQAQEISLGEQQYPPSQQSQGGAYLIDPAVNDYVNRIGRSLARLSAQPDLPYDFVVLNNDVPNAWALPGGKIAINRGLLIMLEDEAQLAAVLGHEIVHAAARHSAEQQASNLGIQILATAVMTQTDNQLYRQAAAMGAGGFQAHYSRENELEADKYGIKYMVADGYDPYGAVELQQTLLQLSKGQQSDWLSALFASHPPSEERVAKNQTLAKTLPKGKRNRDAFLKATQQLRKDQPAYEKHQQALKAAGEKQWDEALALTNQAIRLQPKEARFYITKGRLLDRSDQDNEALVAFNKAESLEPGFFAPHLYRGLLFNTMKKYSEAEQDFLASNQLLPTQPATFYLGEISQRNNKRSKAIQYYQQAAQGGGDIGKAANGRLQSLGVK
jgi:predicted Zn-dependent protease